MNDRKRRAHIGRVDRNNETLVGVIRHNETGQWVVGNEVHGEVTRTEEVPSGGNQGHSSW